MKTKIIEASDPGHNNWGKFIVGRLDTEWQHRSQIDTVTHRPLLSMLGWQPKNIWVLDLATGEGGFFYPGGHATADLQKHRVWVCPMFEPFLAWLYQQDLTDLDKLPDLVTLGEESLQHCALWGHRREGQPALSLSTQAFCRERLESAIQEFYADPREAKHPDVTIAHYQSNLRHWASDLGVNFDQAVEAYTTEWERQRLAQYIAEESTGQLVSLRMTMGGAEP